MALFLKIACLVILEFLHIVSGMSCPMDFIQRYDGSCCKPIQCSENQGYNLCSSWNPPGYDSCYDCPIGTLNNFLTDTSKIQYSFQEESCRKIDCDCAPEAELLNRDECQKTGKIECVCRRQDRRYGTDPLACKGPVTDPQKLSLIRRPGYELKNTGDVAECNQGYFKNKSDDSICIPHTKCPKGFFAIFNGSRSEDRQCQLVTTTVTPSTTTVVKSVTTRLERKKLTYNLKEQRNDTAKENYSNPWFEEYKPTKPSFTDRNNTSNLSEPSKTKTENDGQILVLVLGIAGFSTCIVLVVFLVAVLNKKCCLCRKKEKDLHKKDIDMKEFRNLENSDTGLATCDENKDPAEMNPLLTVIHETQIDYNIGKEEKPQKKDDHLGHYTQLLENPSSQSTDSVVLGSIPKERHQEDYVLQTDCCYNDTDTAEETPVVHVAMTECPMVREKVKEEIQRTDPTNVIPRACCSKPADFGHDSGELQFPSPSPHSIFLPPISTDSLKSDGVYSKLDFNSFGMENPLTDTSASCQRDSDYETGSSTKNDTDKSESFSSLSFDKGFNSLNVHSFDDSSQLSTETQSSVRTGKSVAVVLPFRGNEMETVDEEETCSKTP